MVPIIESQVEFLDKFGANTKKFLVFIGLTLAALTFVLLKVELGPTLKFAFLTSPIWLPLATFGLFYEMWLYTVRKKYNIEQGRVTLEIKLPQEILKSPEAMELVLTQLHQSSSPDNHLQTYIDGKHPPTYGLELVSRGGDVRFYISVPKKKFKNLAETQLYAQYPGLEVHELDIDYTAEIPWDTNKFAYFSLHFGLKKADAYPIKTYIDFGLDKMPKEEEKIDPITTMLEMLGSIGPGEHVWIQMLISANREVTFKEGSLTTVPDWKAEAKGEIKKIIANAAKQAGIKEELIGANVNQFLTDTDKDTIKAIQRSLGKSAFNTSIRAMYIAETNAFNPGERIGGIITAWRSYDDLNRNAIGIKWRTDFDWPKWQDPTGAHREAAKRNELSEYKRRTYTRRGHGDGSKVMTTEELATVFHFPGKVATTPSLGRIPSKRSEPPVNLPVG
jgi:hypothetical protein